MRTADVDDLENIGDLEKYIEESGMILIFLSKGYFLSRNCCREVVAVVKQRKPVVLVWEPEPNKGGANAACGDEVTPMAPGPWDAWSCCVVQAC